MDSGEGSRSGSRRWSPRRLDLTWSGRFRQPFNVLPLNRIGARETFHIGIAAPPPPAGPRSHSPGPPLVTSGSPNADSCDSHGIGIAGSSVPGSSRARSTSHLLGQVNLGEGVGGHLGRCCATDWSGCSPSRLTLCGKVLPREGGTLDTRRTDHPAMPSACRHSGIRPTWSHSRRKA